MLLLEFTRAAGELVKDRLAVNDAAQLPGPRPGHSTTDRPREEVGVSLASEVLLVLIVHELLHLRARGHRRHKDEGHSISRVLVPSSQRIVSAAKSEFGPKHPQSGEGRRRGLRGGSGSPRAPDWLAPWRSRIGFARCQTSRGQARATSRLKPKLKLN